MRSGSGPFEEYKDAKEEWAKRAWQTVDDCHTRYRIERIDPDAPASLHGLISEARALAVT